MKMDLNGLKPFKNRDIINYYSRQKLGLLNPVIKKIYYSWERALGRFSREDQLRIACMCEPPVFFLNAGIMIPHAYGITLSIDEVGCDVYISQNVMVGANAKNLKLGELLTGHKPRIGNLVRIYPHAIISGEIDIGDCVIIAAGAIVTKDVPNRSIVYGKNQVKPLAKHHIDYLKNVLYNARYLIKIPGLMYKGQGMYINNDYLKKRELLLSKITTDDFSQLLNQLF